MPINNILIVGNNSETNIELQKLIDVHLHEKLNVFQLAKQLLKHKNQNIIFSLILMIQFFRIKLKPRKLFLSGQTI